VNPHGDRPRWDEVLAPPAGGLADLRVRIARHERRRRAVRAGSAAAVVVAVAAALAVAVRPSRPTPFAGAPVTFDAIALGLAEPPADPVVVPPDARRDLAVLRVPTRNDRVALYLVGTRGAPGR